MAKQVLFDKIYMVILKMDHDNLIMYREKGEEAPLRGWRLNWVMNGEKEFQFVRDPTELGLYLSDKLKADPRLNCYVNGKYRMSFETNENTGELDIKIQIRFDDGYTLYDFGGDVDAKPTVTWHTGP